VTAAVFPEPAAPADQAYVAKPVVAVKVLVLPMQKLPLLVKLSGGAEPTVTARVAEAVQPLVSVTVRVYVPDVVT
jgi:hypothetical protein